MKLNVLSLFDGMSCGRIALDRSEIEVGTYYASEIDKYAETVSVANYPDIVRMGDVTNWRNWSIDWSSIDLLIAGSPCQGFSMAGKQLAFDDPRSALFFVFVEILNHIKKLNPEVKFLLENVRMKKEFLQIISDHVGVKPFFINSMLVSAQSRPRYYWANWDFSEPVDRGIVLKDIIEPVVDEKYKHSDKVIAGYERKTKRRKSEGKGSNDAFGKMNVADLDGKASCLTARYHKSSITDMSVACGSMTGRRIDPETGRRADNNKSIKPQQRIEIRADQKTNCLTTVQKDNYIVKDAAKRGRGEEIRSDDKANALLADGHQSRWLAEGGLLYRKLTPLECERLQTVPEGYTEGVSNTQRYRMLGNGWTVDVISHIFNGLKSKGVYDGIPMGPCAKRQVTCTLIAPSGKRFSGGNWCRNPQKKCPRDEGEGYEKCSSICEQVGHAEEVALMIAGDEASGCRALISGHDYACEPCTKKLNDAGVSEISILKIKNVPHETTGE